MSFRCLKMCVSYLVIPDVLWTAELFAKQPPVLVRQHESECQ